MDARLLEILVCPVCKARLQVQRSSEEEQQAGREREELVCKPCRLIYPVCDGIPVMLEEAARHLQ